MSWAETVINAGKNTGNIIQAKALSLGEYARDGLHAVPGKNPNPLKMVPSMHRLFNAVGMIALWVIGSKTANLIFGMKSSDGSEIKREEVPAPFRPFHGIVKYNFYGDSDHDKWCKVVHQLIPAAFGATGAILGSDMFFVQNGRKAKIQALMKKATLNPLEADDVSSYVQAVPARIVAGLFAIFGSVSALTPVYGFFLNPSFALASNRKMWAGAAEQFHANFLRAPTNTTSDIAFGPGEALPKVLDKFKSFFYQAAKEGNSEKAGEALAGNMMNALVRPLLPKITSDREQTMRGAIKKLFDDEFQTFKDSGKKPEEIAQEAAAKLTSHFTVLDKDKKRVPNGHQLMRALGIGEEEYKSLVKEMVAGNNGWFKKMAGWLGFQKAIDKVHAQLAADILPPSPSLGRG